MPTISPATTPYYGGGQVLSPADTLRVTGAPNTADFRHNLGTLAIDPVAGNIYALVKKAGSVATWAVLGGATVDQTSAGTTAAPNAMLVNTTYIADTSGVCYFILPSTSAVGATITVCGSGPGGWVIQQNANQTISSQGLVTTTGTSGMIYTTGRYTSVTLVCVVANTTWVVNDFSGTFTYV